MSPADGHRADGLTDVERAIIDLERTWWQASGRKDVAVRERLGLSPSRYYAFLNQLLEKPEAMDYDPLLVRRLRRVRGQRRRARIGGASHQGGFTR
jgi:hypothetical protein